MAEKRKSKKKGTVSRDGYYELVGLKSQYPKKERRVMPRHVVRACMVKDTEFTLSSGAPHSTCTCERCGDQFLAGYMILIQMSSFSTGFVCRLCYDRKTDIKA